jgi:hypothetical protein
LTLGGALVQPTFDAKDFNHESVQAMHKAVLDSTRDVLHEEESEFGKEHQLLRLLCLLCFVCCSWSAAAVADVVCAAWL